MIPDDGDQLEFWDEAVLPRPGDLAEGARVVELIRGIVRGGNVSANACCQIIPLWKYVFEIRLFSKPSFHLFIAK